MRVGRTLYVTNRTAWRQWLARNHRTADDIWLVFYRKDSGKPRIPYNDAVEEALCYGWIDSLVKKLDDRRFVQRFSPRRPGSPLSAMNRERIRRLQAAGKMTRAGLAAVGMLQTARPAREPRPTASRPTTSRPTTSRSTPSRPVPSRPIPSRPATVVSATSRGPKLAPDLQAALQADPVIWRNFRRFPASYRRIRIGWIEGARRRPEEFRKRLRYFVEMTRKNKRFGMVQ